jgi:hypothetical protein
MSLLDRKLADLHAKAHQDPRGGLEVLCSVHGSGDHPATWTIRVVVGGSSRRRRWEEARSHDLFEAIDIASRWLNTATPVEETGPPAKPGHSYR